MNEKPNEIQEPVMRTVHSFVRRQGRLTAAQKRALESLKPKFGIIESDQALDFREIFKNNRPVVLEIGFGNGESLASMAVQQPEMNFLGAEVHTPGVGNLLNLIESKGLNNLRVLHGDIMDTLEGKISAASLSKVQIFFPDPWHKKRHHKRRIIENKFADLLAIKLNSGGLVHLATDWQDYAQQMLEVFSSHPEFINTAMQGDSFPSPYMREQTRFEKRGIKLGHEIKDFIFKRK